MGAQIAGHLANAGIPCLLFDINQDAAEKGKEVLSSLKPAPLYKPKNVELITACNYQHDLQRISETDWILEAVVEQLDVKEKGIFKSITLSKRVCNTHFKHLRYSPFRSHKKSSYQCEKAIYDYALL